MQSANQIKYYRARCQPPLNQQELSIILDVAVTTIQNWERDGVPHANKLFQLVEILVRHHAINDYRAAQDFWTKSGRQSFPEPPQLSELFAVDEANLLCDPAEGQGLALPSSKPIQHRRPSIFQRLHSHRLGVALLGVTLLGLLQIYTLVRSPVGIADSLTGPGGQWITPQNGVVVSGSKLHFAAHVYDAPTGSGVSLIRFTAFISGTWSVACQATTPVHDDVYECDWDLSHVPVGSFLISFDVYSKSKRYNKAPHGIRHGTYMGNHSSTGS